MVRTRKVHPKTRNGCLGCKQRHVKCGEEKPVCANCQKRNVPCSFEAITPSEDVKALLRSTSSTKSSESPPSSIDTPLQSSKALLHVERPINSLTTYLGPDSRRQASPYSIPDTELFQFFVDKTAVSLSSYQKGITPTWQIEIPKLALHNSLVRDMLLAMAAMDLARRSDRTSFHYNTLITSAASRLNMALPDYRLAIEDVNADNCTDLFTCSIFIALYTFADSTIEYRDLASNALTAIDTYQSAYRTRLLTGMLRGLRGCTAIFFQSGSWLLQGPLAGIVNDPEWSDDMFLDSKFAQQDDSRINQLNKLWAHEEQDSDDVQALNEAVWLLRRGFSHVTYMQATNKWPALYKIDESYNRTYRSPYRRAPSGSALCQWPIKVSDRFLRLVDNHNVYAMVLTAHYSVLLHRARSYYWWLEGISELFVATARDVLGPKQRQWIEWPISIVLFNEPESMSDVADVMDVS